MPSLFDNQPADKALAWGAAFYAELDRLDGKIPFTVFHRWMAESVLPLSRVAGATRPNTTTDAVIAAVDAMIEFHTSAAEGNAARSAAWSAAEAAYIEMAAALVRILSEAAAKLVTL